MSDVYLTTKKGNKVDLIDFDINVYDINDIADSLSKQWRWNGAIDKFYSVAEHCVHVSRNVPSDYALDALLHDAAEAYICDVPRPIKRVVPGYKVLENALMVSIGRQFGFNPDAAYTNPVKEADDKLLVTEHKQLRSESALDWENFTIHGVPLEGYDFLLPCWATGIARMQFINRFNYLMGLRKAA